MIRIGQLYIILTYMLVLSHFKGDGVISASECIASLGNEHQQDLIHPERLNSTGYRAYMATMAQVNYHKQEKSILTINGCLSLKFLIVNSF